MKFVQSCSYESLRFSAHRHGLISEISYVLSKGFYMAGDFNVCCNLPFMPEELLRQNVVLVLFELSASFIRHV